MRVAIRADASTPIGTGHVRRMMALGNALRDAGAQVRFVTRALGIDSVGMIASAGFEAVALLGPEGSVFAPDPDVPHSEWAQVSTERDVADTLAALEGFAPERVIIDHYAFDASWHDAVSRETSAPVMVMDDLADRPLGGRWVVDHNYHPDHAAKYEGRLARGTTLLAGPRYAMIDPVYRDAPRYAFSDEVRSIGVFMGGIDLGGDTLVVLDALEEAGWSGPVEVVATRHNSACDAITERLADWPGGVLSMDLPNLAGFFARHDIQVGAGGGAIWERCCIGPPTIGLVCADNQAKSIPHADAAELLIGIDHMGDPSRRRAALVTSVQHLIADADLRRALSGAAQALVDGYGLARLSVELIKED